MCCGAIELPASAVALLAGPTITAMRDDLVTLTHPDGHGPIEVTATKAAVLVTQGWERATPLDDTLDGASEGAASGDPVDLTIDLTDINSNGPQED